MKDFNFLNFSQAWRPIGHAIYSCLDCYLLPDAAIGLGACLIDPQVQLPLKAVGLVLGWGGGSGTG